MIHDVTNSLYLITILLIFQSYIFLLEKPIVLLCNSVHIDLQKHAFCSLNPMLSFCNLIQKMS